MFFSIPLVHNFWSDFEFAELTENMRQREDPHFACILDRIRVGVPTNADIDFLTIQLIKYDITFDKLKFATEKYIDEYKLQHEPLCIMPLVSTSNSLNTLILNKLQVHVISITAIDSNKVNFKKSSRKKHDTNFEQNILSKLKRNQTAGLETNLCIGIGAKVMLTRNLDTGIGLVNGAIGLITNIEINSKIENDVNKITVKFQNVEQAITIQRFVADFQQCKDTYNTRAQFPITLAWAVTVHKSQGLSLDYTILDLGPDIFEGGMAYVALSRARVLNKVYLIELDPSSLYCCQEAYLEYQRLYRVAQLTSPLPLFINTLKDDYRKKCHDKVPNNKQKDATNSKKVAKNKQPSKRLDTNIIDNDFLHLTCSINVTNFRTYPLIFSNTSGTNCFSNVIMQLLLHCHPVFLTEINNRQIELNSAQIRFKKFYNRFYSYQFNDKMAYDTKPLKNIIAQIYRDSTLPDYQVDQQEDSFLFLIHVIMALPISIQKLFTFNTITDSECEICKTKNTYVQANETHITINHSTNTDLNHAVQLKSSSERHCNTCQELKQHNDQSTLVFDEGHNYLLAYVHSFSYSKNSGKKINARLHGLDNLSFDIPNTGNHKFKLKTIVIRTGGNADNGHFKIWTINLQTNKWLLLNDSIIRTYQNIFKSLDNVFFILFEKV